PPLGTGLRSAEPPPARPPFARAEANALPCRPGRGYRDSTKAKLRGIVHGKTIELPHETGRGLGGGRGRMGRAANKDIPISSRPGVWGLFSWIHTAPRSKIEDARLRDFSPPCSAPTEFLSLGPDLCRARSQTSLGAHKASCR